MNAPRLRSKSGNTFDGIIREFPGLKIDKFNRGSETPTKLFLLSHCHSDHLAGLDNNSFFGMVYCSRTTRKLLELDPSYKHVMKFVIPQKCNQPINVDVNGENLTITLIPTYHCPGSVMFLIEGKRKSVLFTGDVRAESWWTSTLSKNPHLFPYTTPFKTLDNIYLDTTFGYRGEPFMEMLSNNDGLNIALDLISSYPEDEEVGFYFADSVTGFEEVWAQLLSVCRERLHTTSEIQERITKISDPDLYEYSELLSRLSSTSQKDSISISRFHACGTYPDSCILRQPEFSVRIKHVINFNVMDYIGVCLPVPLDDIDPRELELVKETKNGNKIYLFRGSTWILSKDKRELLPRDIKLIFSRHSSYSECYDFIKLFRPAQVYPCTESKVTWNNGFQMKRIFGELCTGSEFSYDEERTKLWDRPKEVISKRPIFTINRWIAGDCVKEYDFLRNISNSEIKQVRKTQGQISRDVPKELFFRFRGQHQVSALDRSLLSCDDQDFMNSRAHDFHIQKLLIGRNESRYKNFLQGSRDAYKVLNRNRRYPKDDESLELNCSKLGQDNDYYDQDSFDTDSISLMNQSQVSFGTDSTDSRHQNSGKSRLSEEHLDNGDGILQHSIFETEHDCFYSKAQSFSSVNFKDEPKVKLEIKSERFDDLTQLSQNSSDVIELTPSLSCVGSKRAKQQTFWEKRPRTNSALLASSYTLKSVIPSRKSDSDVLSKLESSENSLNHDLVDLAEKYALDSAGMGWFNIKLSSVANH